MSSAIMRFQKLHTAEEIGHALGHNKRLRKVKHVDGEMSYMNTYETYVDDIKKHVKGLDKLHKKTTGKKARKDAVRLVEVLMTSDKEFFSRVDDKEYFESCKEWLINIFGEENILSMDIHKDESTPHAHFLVAPMRDNQYSCKKIINGRNAVRGLQNSFYDHVKGYGLERGELVEFTKAKHKSSLEFAEDVQKGKESVSEMTEREKESYAAYGTMVREQIQELQEENKNLIIENGVLAMENEELKEEIEELKNEYNVLETGVKLVIRDKERVEQHLEQLKTNGRYKLMQESGKCDVEEVREKIEEVER